jgi:hypothetical protein
MTRTLAFALAAATIIGASSVSAQTIDLGRGGPSIDLRGDRARDRDYRRDEERREMRRDRDISTGSVGRCREVTIRERDEYGNTETRRRQDCR